MALANCPGACDLASVSAMPSALATMPNRSRWSDMTRKSLITRAPSAIAGQPGPARP